MPQRQRASITASCYVVLRFINKCPEYRVDYQTNSDLNENEASDHQVVGSACRSLLLKLRDINATKYQDSNVIIRAVTSHEL